MFRNGAWLVFCATCLQLAFQQPYVILIPGERANLFSGLLCAIALFAALWTRGGGKPAGSPVEWGLSLILAVLAMLSGALSETAWSSSYRSFILIASGLGGFWCARILLATPERQRVFARFCCVIFAGMVLVGFLGYALKGNVSHFLDQNPHPLCDRLLILAFGPLVLLLDGSARERIISVALLCLGCVIFYLSDLRSAMLIPLALCLMALWMRQFRFNHLLVVLLLFAAALPFFFSRLPAWKMGKEHEPTYYRFENYPFSLHIVRHNPWFGIGLRAPREKFVEGYHIIYPYVTKEKFTESVKNVVTSENTFLTLGVGLGAPFLILYCAGLIGLFARLFRSVRHPPGAFYESSRNERPGPDLRMGRFGGEMHLPSKLWRSEALLPPCSEAKPRSARQSRGLSLSVVPVTKLGRLYVPCAALLLPVTAALIHFQVFDGLLYAQNCWYFHILLGLAPYGGPGRDSDYRETVKTDNPHASTVDS